MEDLGFVERGRGGFFTFEGGTRRDGAMPINASGGLKSKGHPVGATGVVAAFAISCSSFGCEAGDRQLKPAFAGGWRRTWAGAGATCVVTILGC